MSGELNEWQWNKNRRKRKKSGRRMSESIEATTKEKKKSSTKNDGTALKTANRIHYIIKRYCDSRCWHRCFSR